MVTRETWEAIPFLAFGRDRLLPVAGGLLDQTESFLDALGHFNLLMDQIESYRDGDE